MRQLRPEADHELEPQVDEPEHAHAPASGAHRDAMAAWSAESAGPSAPVQMHAEAHHGAMSDWSTEQGAAAASRSVEGASQPLPHGDAIQRSFGAHDVSGVRAEVGGAAGDAASSIGATAFATGTNVGFAGTPDLHTAAHEAAHVVQQRQGVVSFKGLNTIGDAHEQHADRVADAVVAGQSAAPILDELAPGPAGPAGAIQRDTPQGTDVKPAGPAPKGQFLQVAALPGTPLVHVSVVAARLPADMVTLLGVDPKLEVDLYLTTDGTSVSAVVGVNGTFLVAQINTQAMLDQLLGPASAALSQLGDLVPKATNFVEKITGKLTAVADGRVRVNLWQLEGTWSYVTIDLASAMRGAWAGSITGALRPIDAHLDLGKAGRVDVFEGEQRTLAAIPTSGRLGDLDVSSKALRKDVLGIDDDQDSVNAAVFWNAGKLAVAIKPDAAATTGVVGEIDFAYLLGRLRALGDKIGGLIDGLLSRIQGPDLSFLHWGGGGLKFDLGGAFKNFFDFDFNLALPRLGGGGGLNLGALWPSSWSFELPGFQIGALPDLNVPWLKWPKLGSFDLPDFGRLSSLFTGIGLPALPELKLPTIDVHWQGWSLGLSLDLPKLWPSLEWPKGGSTLGFDLDLSALLDALRKAGGAIAKAAEWIWSKLKGAGKLIANWIHLGADGVIRIFDGSAADVSTTPMLGFSLLRLLDGAQATDLLPSEIRYHGKDVELDMGLAGEVEGTPGAGKEEREKGAAVPHRPATPLAETEGVELPESVIGAMGLAPGATAYASVDGHYPHLILYTEAKSGHREGLEAARASIDISSLVEMIARRLPAPKGSGKPKLPVPKVGGGKLGNEQAAPTAGGAGNDALVIELGDVPEPGKEKDATTPYARAAWSLKKLAAARSLGALMPDEITADAPGKGGVTRGPFSAPDGLIGQRFHVASERVRKDVLNTPDGKDDVWLGVYYGSPEFAITATPTEDGNEGLMGHINVEWLFHQLEKLGALGEKILDAIGSKLVAGWDKIKGFAAKLKAMMGGLLPDMFSVNGGLFDFHFGGGSIGWDFKKLIGNLSFDGFSLDGLIPDIKGFRFPELPSLALSFGSFEFPGFKLPEVHFPSHFLSNLFGKGGGIDWNGLPDFGFGVAFDGISLGISIDLSFLDGIPGLGDLLGGHRKLGFGVDLEALLKPFGKLWDWLKSKFPGGKPSPDNGTQISLGTDGVLRLWDNKGAHIGFQLKNLLNGFQIEDIVPVEMAFEVTGNGDAKDPDAKPEKLAELEFGQVANVKPGEDPPKPRPGQVLVVKPQDAKSHGEINFAAPELVRTHLGAPPGAALHVELLEAGDHDAILFASVDKSDRGMMIRVDSSVLQKFASAHGPMKSPSDMGGITIDWGASAAKKSLVINFGQQPSADPRKRKHEEVKPHGYASWRLARFFDGLSLSDMVPDELNLTIAQGDLTVGAAIALDGLERRGAVPMPDFVTDSLDISEGSVWTNASNGEENDLQIALVGEKDKEGKPVSGPGIDAKHKPGLHLGVDGKFLDTIEMKIETLARSAGKAMFGGAKKNAGASASVAGGDKFDERHIHIKPTGPGLRVQRGEDGKPDLIYATFGWNDITTAVTTHDLSVLTPTEFRVATSSMSLEMTEAPEAAKHDHVPTGAKQVKELHPFLKDALHDVLSLRDEQYLFLDLEKSKLVSEDMIAATGEVLDADKDGNVTHGKKFTLGVDIDVLLAHVLPGRRDKKPKKKKKKGPVSFDLHTSKDITPDDKADGDVPGIEAEVEVSKKNAAGHTRALSIKAGWSVAQLIDVLMNLPDILDGDEDAMGKLIPKALSGSFHTEKFKLTIANQGGPDGTDIDIGWIPFLPALVEAFSDKKTAQASKLWVEIPGSVSEISKRFKDALIGDGFADIAKASLALPETQPDGSIAYKYYSLKLSVGLEILKIFAKFIPYVGEAIMLIDMAAGFLEDPVGKLENALYTPELLYQFVTNLPDIVDNLKNTSLKEFVMMAMMSDVTTKQAVMAARLHKKLKALGLDPKKDKKNAAAAIGKDEAYVEFLAGLEEDQLKELYEFNAFLDASGLAEQALGGTEPQIPKDGIVDVQALKRRRLAIEAGYTEFAKVMEETDGKEDEYAKSKREAAAKKFGDEMEKHLKTGIKASPLRDARGEEETADHKPDPTATEEKLTDVSGVAKPTEKQRDDADMLFQRNASGDVIEFRKEYLIEKYGALSADQLADLLINGKTQVDSPNGKLELPLLETERDFVRNLFLVKTDRTAKAQGLVDDKAPTPDEDRAMVERWKNGDFKKSGATGEAHDPDHAKPKPSGPRPPAGQTPKPDATGGATTGQTPKPDAGGAPGGAPGTTPGGGGAQESEADEDQSYEDQLWGDDKAWQDGFEASYSQDINHDGKLSNADTGRNEDGTATEESEGEGGEGGSGGDGERKGDKAETDNLWEPYAQNVQQLISWDGAKLTMNPKEAERWKTITAGKHITTKEGSKASFDHVELDVYDEQDEASPVIQYGVNVWVKVTRTDGSTFLKRETYAFVYDKERKEVGQMGVHLSSAELAAIAAAFEHTGHTMTLKAPIKLTMVGLTLEVQELISADYFEKQDAYGANVRCKLVSVAGGKSTILEDIERGVRTVKVGENVALRLPVTFPDSKPPAAE